MDFSAWLEVFLDGRWHTMDARHNHPRIGRIVMGRGRDAADVAISTAFGVANLVRFEVVTDEQAQNDSSVVRQERRLRESAPIETGLGATLLGHGDAPVKSAFSNSSAWQGPGRVARPFGSALTDPGVRLSRTRLFPRVTRIVSPLCP